MFENLLNFWKGKDFLVKVLDDFREMLVDAGRMYDSVCARLIDNEESPDLKNKVYELDAKINKLKKDIRKRVVEHLALQPTVDASACLLLMSVVKDAERLGDYCKNLLEVSQFLKNPINKTMYRDLFNGIDDEISMLFKSTEEAFMESDEKKAISAWKYENKIAKRCDKIVEKVAASDMPVNEAVGFVLISRYFKRLSAHLTNIATSVVLPISELDYYDEKSGKENE